MKEEWTKVNYWKEENKEKISKIIKIEMELTEAIRNGHKSFWGDQFREKLLVSFSDLICGPTVNRSDGFLGFVPDCIQSFAKNILLLRTHFCFF